MQRRPKIVATAIYLAISACLLAESVYLTKTVTPGQGGWWGGPAAMVGVVGALLAIFTVIFFYQEVICKTPTVQPREESTRNRGILSPSLMLIGYVIALILSGYLISTFLFFLIYLKEVTKLNWRRSIVLSLSGAALFWAIFAWYAGIPFPRGFVSFLDS